MQEARRGERPPHSGVAERFERLGLRPGLLSGRVCDPQTARALRVITSGQIRRGAEVPGRAGARARDGRKRLPAGHRLINKRSKGVQGALGRRSTVSRRPGTSDGDDRIEDMTYV